MQITHEEARKLMQFNLDQPLITHGKNMLLAHLETCNECRAYAEDLKEVESILSPLMKRRWNVQPAPLPMAALIKSRSSSWHTNIILATRTAMICLVFAAFVFSAWQFAHSASQASHTIPVSVLPIPTPSGQSTSTKSSFQSCEEMVYQVQEYDTLESIASQFSVSKEKIMTINNMGTETINSKMELLIPICNSTPTSTLHPSILTTTFTPLTGPTTTTPGG
jgi:LysM repeat protein